MDAGVPTVMPVAVRSAPVPAAWIAFAMPKSATFTLPSPVTGMFSGLRSPWTIPRVVGSYSGRNCTPDLLSEVLLCLARLAEQTDVSWDQRMSHAHRSNSRSKCGRRNGVQMLLFVRQVSGLPRPRSNEEQNHAIRKGTRCAPWAGTRARPHGRATKTTTARRAHHSGARDPLCRRNERDVDQTSEPSRAGLPSTDQEVKHGAPNPHSPEESSNPDRH